MENIYNRLKELAITKFPTIVEDAIIIKGPLNVSKSLRIFLSEGSFVEIWISENKYSYHWERRMINGKMYRQDNAPHHEEINTFPKHFHQGTEDNVKESKISSDPEKGVIEFLDFVKKKIEEKSIF